MWIAPTTGNANASSNNNCSINMNHQPSSRSVMFIVPPRRKVVGIAATAASTERDNAIHV